jgi:opacity protein-like surface antigen
MKRLMMLGASLAGLAAAPAKADEQYFGYTYSAEVLGKGQTETEFWVTDRRGKGEGHYDAQDYRVELEHGFTDRLTVSGYANFVGHHISGLDPDFEHTNRDLAFKGFSTEFKYNVLSPFKDGFGLTLYAEPGWSRIHSVEGKKGTEYELEFKAILQKNFLDDRLIWAANLTFEPEWEIEKEVDDVSGAVESEWEKELKLEASSGLSYRLAPGWYAGVEGRYASVYPNWTSGLHRETYAVFAGPAIHYGGKKWWATLSYQPQLFGSPSPGGKRALDEYEKRELRLKIGYDF